MKKENIWHSWRFPLILSSKFQCFEITLFYIWVKPKRKWVTKIRAQRWLSTPRNGKVIPDISLMILVNKRQKLFRRYIRKSPHRDSRPSESRIWRIFTPVLYYCVFVSFFLLSFFLFSTRVLCGFEYDDDSIVSRVCVIKVKKIIVNGFGIFLVYTLKIINIK